LIVLQAMRFVHNQNWPINVRKEGLVNVNQLKS
jgi:hypothetical protein